LWQIRDVIEDAGGMGGVSEWDDEKDYEFPAIVGYDGKYYIALQDVPAGTPLDDEDYWAEVGAETDPIYTADKPAILRHYDIPNKDWSVEAELPLITDNDGEMEIDYEFGYATPDVPHDDMDGPYNANWLSLGGKKEFEYKNGDEESTKWIHNFGNSEVDTQILSHNRPLVWNGQDNDGDGGRHEMAYVEDMDEVLEEANDYTDEEVAKAKLADQIWLPAVDNYSVLPTVPNEDLNYLCRVFNYYTDGVDEYDAGVYQWIAEGAEWTYFSDNQDWVDETELATKVDKTDLADKLYGTDEDGDQIVIDRDELGKVDTVDRIEADEDKNVQITYIYDTEIEWNNGHAGKELPDGTVIDLPPAEDLPVGAQAIKTYLANDPMYIMSEAPDYSAMETTNRLPNQTSSWTVDRDGYVQIFIRASVDSAGHCSLYILVNGKVVGGGIIPGSNTWAPAQYAVPKVFKGDVVSFWTDMGSYSTSGYWMPARYKAVPIPNLVVEVGGDYSLEEQPVLVMDPATKQVRQKTWIDGRPIWRRTYQYDFTNVPIVVGTINYVIDDTTPFYAIVKADLNHGGGTTRMLTGSGEYINGDGIWRYGSGLLLYGGDLMFQVYSIMAYAERTFYGHCTVEYTRA
jgi:hypothetical protein